jgi:hypothetical protein
MLPLRVFRSLGSINSSYVAVGSFATEAAKAKAHARPLRSESGQLAEHLAMSALCHLRTHAPQQNSIPIR